MSVAAKSLEQLIQDLSPHYKTEVLSFVTTLLNKQERQHKQRKLRQDWAETVLVSHHTSVDLQHLALEWRSE